MAKLRERLRRHLDAFQDAGLEVAVEDHEAGLLEAATGGEELVEDVFAGAVFFEHLAQAANLAFNPGEPVL